MIGLMKYIYMILKPFSFLPALTIMYLIFSFSSQTGEVSGDLSYRVSYKVVEVAEMVDQVVDLGIEPGNTDYYAEKINYYVRKAAHMTEYFCLAVAVAFMYVQGTVRLNNLSAQIADLKSEKENLLSEQNALQTEIDKNINLDEIRTFAEEKLHMVYPGADQIIYYNSSTEDYFRQYESVDTAN